MHGGMGVYRWTPFSVATAFALALRRSLLVDDAWSKTLRGFFWVKSETVLGCVPPFTKWSALAV
jgi:hypothetical protein